ncbi:MULTISPECIES: TenA family protein [unclassified Wolbachia]|uniref:TenA family protein n=1 Tax=unclassified Wolbachia TaxID=2640676 RepID=UPI0022317B37|nr:TenA family protein [Wolbachia endosymbiont (group A) of Apoderus coryli]
MYNDIKEEFCSIAIKESSDLIDRIEEHPFYVELMNGKLSYKKFKFYVQQTFLCLVDCTRAFLIIASRANDIETMDKLTFIARKIFSMRSLCEEQFTECNSSDSHKRSKSSSALIDFFMRAAYHNSVAESLAASYPCFGMCQITFQHTVKDSIPSSNKYKKWINLYNTNIVDNTADAITEIVNKLYRESSNKEKKKMLEFFRNGLELEVIFWDEVYYSNISSKEY